MLFCLPSKFSVKQRLPLCFLTKIKDLKILITVAMEQNFLVWNSNPSPFGSSARLWRRTVIAGWEKHMLTPWGFPAVEGQSQCYDFHLPALQVLSGLCNWAAAGWPRSKDRNLFLLLTSLHPSLRTSWLKSVPFASLCSDFWGMASHFLVNSSAAQSCKCTHHLHAFHQASICDREKCLWFYGSPSSVICVSLSAVQRDLKQSGFGCTYLMLTVNLILMFSLWSPVLYNIKNSMLVKSDLVKGMGSRWESRLN